MALGCGGNDGSNAGPGDGGNSGSGVTLQAMYDADCAWRTRCDRGPCSPQTCSAAIYRADAVAAAARCYEKLACDGHDDDCELAALATTPDPETVINSCIKRYGSTCPQYSDIDESLCIAYPLLIPSKQAEFNQCLEQGICAEQCLQAVAVLCSS